MVSKVFDMHIIMHQLCGNCTFPQKNHTRKLGEMTMFYAMRFQSFFVKHAHYYSTSILSQNGEFQTYVWESEGKKCSIFGKFGVLCFLETTVFRFALLPYYRRVMIMNDVFIMIFEQC